MTNGFSKPPDNTFGITATITLMCAIVCSFLHCDSYSLAVFVGWLVVVHRNNGLIFTLRQLITILSHELINTHKHTHMKETDYLEMRHTVRQFYNKVSLSGQKDLKYKNRN